MNQKKDNIIFEAKVDKVLKEAHLQAFYNQGYILQNDNMAHQTFNNNEYGLPISRAQGNNPFGKDVSLTYLVEPCPRPRIYPPTNTINVVRKNLYENK